MKKVLFGCLALLVILGVGGGIAAYHFVWKPAKAYAGEFAKLKEYSQLNQGVKKTATFTPPADALLTREAVDRFLKTQDVVKNGLGPRLDQLSAKYRTLEQMRSAGSRPSVTETINAFKDLIGLIVEAKRLQVDALNQNGFSLQEYDWTRRRVYEASGIPVPLDFEQALKEIADGKDVGEIQMGGKVEAPEANRALVAPHVKQLSEGAVLAAFGL